MSYEMSHFTDAKKYIEKACGANFSAHTAVVLGSGLSHFATILKKNPATVVIPFHHIPHFKTSTIEGHCGELILGKLGATPIIAMSGRLHFYEGYDAQEITFPIRVLATLGIKHLILTNAAGAIGDNYEPGHLMAIKDHINMSGASSLRGKNYPEFGPRFVDMSIAYDPALIAFAKKAALEADIIMHEGVYLSVMGPCYETPAEIRMFKTLGADAVGMSTVLETMIARHMGVKVLGISCLTNKAAGLSSSLISHEEVVENNAKVASRFSMVLEKIIEQIHQA